MNKRIRKKIDWRCGFRKYKNYYNILWFERNIVRTKYLATKYPSRYQTSLYTPYPNVSMGPLDAEDVRKLTTKPSEPKYSIEDLTRLMCNHTVNGELCPPLEKDGNLICPICGQPWEDCIDEEKVREKINWAYEQLYRPNRNFPIRNIGQFQNYGMPNIGGIPFRNGF